MRVPSGDQTGPKSWPGSNVNRVVTCRAGSIIHTSRFPFTTRSSATRPPSGDSSGLSSENASGGPTSPNDLPDRSNHRSCRLLPERLPPQELDGQNIELRREIDGLRGVLPERRIAPRDQIVQILEHHRELVSTGTRACDGVWGEWVLEPAKAPSRNSVLPESYASYAPFRCRCVFLTVEVVNCSPFARLLADGKNLKDLLHLFGRQNPSGWSGDGGRSKQHLGRVGVERRSCAARRKMARKSQRR